MSRHACNFWAIDWGFGAGPRGLTWVSGFPPTVGGLPWANAVVFDTKIRRNVKLAECPSHGKSIFQYAPNCPGAIDYASLANEVLGGMQVDLARSAIESAVPVMPLFA